MSLLHEYGQAERRCQWQLCLRPGEVVNCGGVPMAVLCPEHSHEMMRRLGMQIEAEGRTEEGRDGYLDYCQWAEIEPDRWWR